MTLQVVAQKSESTPNTFSDSIDDVCSTLYSAVFAQLKGTAAEMVEKAQSECPKVVDEASLANLRIILFYLTIVVDSLSERDGLDLDLLPPCFISL